MSDKPIASESNHWYDLVGNPVYEVPRANGEGMRPTTLADARKLNLVPSVTLILRCAAAPGLEAWKARQLLEAALTLPKLPNETLDDYAARVVEDSRAQGKKASEKGTDLHKAIEIMDLVGEWGVHVEKVLDTLLQYGIDLTKGNGEHSFASPLGYGGKIDFVQDDLIADFKTRKEIKDAKRLAYDEHIMQLAAYSHGLVPGARCLNVFIGIDDLEIRIIEHSKEEIERGFSMFKMLLDFWKLKNKYANGNLPK